MKDVELKLISELMKNSRRSDRELAKTIGVSQPTVSRLIRKLEKNGKFSMIGWLGLVICEQLRGRSSEISFWADTKLIIY